jgi:outer membrane protein assembly factor BamA
MRITKALPTLLFVALFAFCGLALARPQQNSFDKLSPAQRTLIAIKVTGSKRYSEQTVAAASGLQMGTPMTEDEFKKASRRLGDMGVFTDIEYSYSYSSAGTKLEFHVTDVDKFVPVRFEDFVWFPESEMLARIKSHAPLFDGQLPLFGRLPEEVSDVLQAMLVEKAIPGHVEFAKSGPANGPVDSIVYKVSDVLIQIRNVEFTGAGEAELPALKSASQRLTDTEYSRTVLASLVQKQLLPVYYSRGYLKAEFGTPEPKVVKQPSVAGNEGIRNLTIVDVVFPVTPGEPYKFSSLEWTGNRAFPADVLQKMVRARPGEVANTVRLSDNLKDIQKLYGSKGYVTASFKAEASFDDAAGKVAMKLVANEGYEYVMGDLEFRGLDNSLMAKLRGAWKIRQGEVYDATYLPDYLNEAHKLLPPTLDWDVSSHVTPNGRDKTVDVDLIYSVKSPSK